MRMRKVVLWTALMALTALFLAGCTSAKKTVNSNASHEHPSTAAGNLADSKDDLMEEGEEESEASYTPREIAPDKDGVIRVDTVEDLLDAIRPDVYIEIQPGYYNMTDYIAELRTKKIYDSWQEAHPYVSLVDVYDGVGVVIHDVENISIEGGAKEGITTELVVDPRYATVLTFENCNYLRLYDLTLGHTNGGECSGNVLDFTSCGPIFMSGMDLYGCGEIGIETDDCWGTIEVNDSIIRDCSLGPFAFDNGNESIQLNFCSLIGSEYGGFYVPDGEPVLQFFGCVFGRAESEVWYGSDQIITESCSWDPDVAGETYEEPEADAWADGEDVFDPSILQKVAFAPEDIAYTIWYGYLAKNAETDQTLYYPYRDEELGEYLYMQLSISGNGTAWFNDGVQNYDLKWIMEGEETAKFWSDSIAFTLTAYMPDVEYEEDYETGVTWVRLQMEDWELWFY